MSPADTPGIECGAPGVWVEPVVGGLNVDPAGTAFLPTIADIGSVPHVAWDEGPGGSTQIRVKRLAEVADGGPGGGGGGSTPGGGGGTGGGGGGPTAIASASALTLSPSAFPAASRGASVAAKRPRKTGTTVRYRLSAAARVRFSVEKPATGRKVGKRCVKPTRANRSRPRCRRFVAVRGSFTHTGRAGPNSFHFTGRLSARKLSPGRYRLVTTPLGADGRRGTPIRKTFRITP